MLDAQIPKYRRLSPIGYWAAWACFVFDTVLAYWLYRFPVVQIDSPFAWVYWWPIVFITLALCLAVALLKNNMKGVRAAMILNVIVKAYWAWTLVVITNRIGIAENLSILDLWFFAAAIQAIIAVFTPPRIDYGLFAK